jgi:hypothetical protein
MVINILMFLRNCVVPTVVTLEVVVLAFQSYLSISAIIDIYFVKQRFRGLTLAVKARADL